MNPGEDLVVFISSTVGRRHLENLNEERAAIRDVVENTLKMQAWDWRRTGSRNPPPHEVFIDGVRRSDIFALLVGNDVTEGVKDEYRAAEESPLKPKLVFYKLDCEEQDPAERMSAACLTFFREIMPGHTVKSFTDLDGLRAVVEDAIRAEVSKAARRHWNTDATRMRSERADKTFLLLGAGELAMETARSLRRYSGNRVVLEGIDRYRTPPGRDELHVFNEVELPWTDEKLVDRSVNTLTF